MDENSKDGNVEEQTVNTQENQESASDEKADSNSERRLVMPRRSGAVLD